MGAGPLRKGIHSRRRTGIEVYRVWAAVRRPVTCLLRTCLWLLHTGELCGNGQQNYLTLFFEQQTRCSPRLILAKTLCPFPSHSSPTELE